jgi:hypothetical protein
MSDSMPHEEAGVKHRDNRTTIRWSDGELDGIEEIAKRRNSRDHSDLNTSDVIRMATRKLIAEELGMVPTVPT